MDKNKFSCELHLPIAYELGKFNFGTYFRCLHSTQRISSNAHTNIFYKYILESIRVDNNQFYGTLPQNLFTMKKLKYLVANDNKFNGTLSPNIGNLTSLLWINLRGNNLHGEIPVEIQNIKGLGKYFLRITPEIENVLFSQIVFFHQNTYV